MSNHYGSCVLLVLATHWAKRTGLIRSTTLFTDLSFACSFPFHMGTHNWNVRGVYEISPSWSLWGLYLIHASPVINFLYLLRKRNGWYHTIQFKCHNKAHTLRCKFPGHNTTSMKKCPLTNKCGCWINSKRTDCCTGVVGTCSLHIWNIQRSFVAENIFSITRTPRNDRCRLSFHFTDKWCSLFTANKDFWRKFNHRRNCYELKKQQHQNLKNNNLECDN